MISTHLGISVPIAVESARAGEVTHYIADLSAAQNILGYTPKIALKDGLVLAIEFYVTWFKKKGWLVNDPK